MSELKEKLLTLGFKPKDGKDCVYIKKYGAYEISIDYNETTPEKSCIDYGTKILCNRKTTCNFHQEETFVVLECVNRLLEKGYKPENIELEKSWGMGHTEGYLDILVKDETNNSFAMIECKTWGKEYDKYVKETFTHKNKGKENDGGQIFSYLQQEPKTTKAICYYTSKITNNIEYKNAIIHNKEDWAELNQVERFNRWTKTFETNGIFEDDIPLYKIESKAIRRKDLKELKREDSEGIYNQFAEILRHNVVSDKPNAFNKIINMFLCKIWDEDNTAEDKEVKFQTRTLGRDKTDEELLEDLNDLYKAGMNAYLEKDVSDVTKDDFETLLSFVGDSSKKSDFEELYKTLRLYKNNEFAFKEVYDKKSFNDNAKVVREVVELLQDKQLRYSHKQQFLGDFFEKLLNDSIKQEAGQFFTPVPLTQFIIKSLPIKEIIQDKIKNNEPDTLPYVIDYACGTGHFLTEIMDNIDRIIKEDIDIDKITRPAVKRELKIWKDSEFEWAEKYIYGIDLDYRLIKASKISCFLNGDGKANLLHANGLAPFNSENYIGKLHSNTGKQDNQQFDILIANPPYSVKAFKPTIKDGDKRFELFSNFSENSSEIECLFVERAKQLIKEGGYLGIVLPVSLLTNDKVYIKTREILLKYFDIKGILALQDNAFMATGTKTIILLMQRRSNTYWEQINLAVNNFFENYRNVAVAGIEKAFSTFVETNYEDLAFDDYISIIKNSPTETAKQTEFYEEHKNLSIDELKTLEQDKMLYFFLAYNSKLVLANSGEKAEEKQFLGYEFSNRRGQEGINIYKDEEGHIISSLFSDVDTQDNEKLNTYVYKNFIGEDIDTKILDINLKEEHPLKNHIDYCRLSELIDFSLPKFEKVINLNSKKKLKFESKYVLKTIDDIIPIIETGSRPSGGVANNKSGVLSLGGEHIDNTSGYLNLLSPKYIPLDFYNKATQGKLEKYDVLICKDGALTGKVALVRDELDTVNAMINEHVYLLRTGNSVTQKYIFTILYSNMGQNILKFNITGAAQGGLNSTNLKRIKLPLPPIDIQEKIVNEINIEESKEYDKRNNIKALNESIINLMGSNRGVLNSLDALSIKITDGSHNPPPKVYAKDFYMLSAINITNYGIDLSAGCRYISESDYIRENKRTQIQENDILLSIVGTIGKSTLVDRNISNITVQRSVAVIRPNIEIINPKYLLFYIRSALFQNKLEELAHGSQQQGVYLNQLKDIKIPVPDMEKQKRIVAEILPLEAEIEKLQKEIDEIPAKKQAILDKYLK